MSTMFWTGLILFVATACGLVFALWYGFRGNGRRDRNRNRKP